MKQKKLAICFLVVLLVVALFVVAACDFNWLIPPNENEHTHSFADVWSSDETYHWLKATCEHTDEIKDKAEHDFVEGICYVCDYVDSNSDDNDSDELLPTPQPHEHTFADDWTSDNNFHWRAATCEHSGEISNQEVHTYIDGKCLICGRVEPSPTEGLYYELNEDGQSYSVMMWISVRDTDIVIPSTYNGKPVTSIFEQGFYGNNKLTSITIPSSVTSIGDEAFCGCSNLISIVIPSSVTSIGEYAFDSCSSIERFAVDPENVRYKGTNNCLIDTENNTLMWGFKNSSIPSDGSVTSIDNYAFWGCRSLTSITIPSSVTSIGDAAFMWCSNLQTITFESNSQLTYIGDQAFAYCSRLTSITIPSGVTSIGEAFWYCSNLVSITISSSVTSIDGRLCVGCSNIESITVEQGNIRYKSSNNCLIDTENNTLILGCKNSIIPSDGSVTSIGDKAFDDSIGLTSIIIPSCVTSIGGSAFDNCSNLRVVTFDDNSQLTSIGEAAFSYCSSLTSITIPSSVTSIGNFTFSGSGLTSITIPSSVASIGERVFAFCSNLTSITIPLGVTSIGDWAFEDCINLTSITIPSSVTSIGEHAFWSCINLHTVSFDSNSQLASIGISAFGECWGLTSITIPSSVTSIGNGAFGHSINLQTVIFDSNSQLTSIGGGAFTDCISLTSIIIPSNVTSIGDRVFAGCNSIESITVDSGNVRYKSVNNCLIDIESNTLIWGFKNSIIPSDGSVTSIGDGAFAYCNSLTSITIPSSITSIGDRAFVDCSNLQTVIFEGNSQLTSIGEGAFQSCRSLTTITIPSNVTSIGKYVFAVCSSLKSITISSSVISIGEGAFDQCSDLTTVFYCGTKSQWNLILSSSKYLNLDATCYYYSDEEPQLNDEGTDYTDNYWHWAEDGVTPEIWVYNKED